MKRKILSVIFLALMLCACGKETDHEGESSALNAEQTASAAQPSETADQSDDVYEGIYVEKIGEIASIELKSIGNNVYSVHIEWPESSSKNIEWDFSGEFNGKAVMEYSECTKTITVYDENGQPTEDKNGKATPYVEYSDGTGNIKMANYSNELCISWDDAVEHTGSDTIFIKQ